MKYIVEIKKKIRRNLWKLPAKIQAGFFMLVKDLQKTGPVVKQWHNFSTLGKNKYHCHLSYSWVACWSYEGKNIIIEVYYVGSRENAPY
ncbi:hypothetical protein KAR34_01115 [bacterium]|nr:hypothetical protein [bacterium]